MKNNNEYIIRKAADDDIPRLTDLLIELFFIETDFQIDGEKHSRGISLILNNNEKSIMFIAEHKGLIVGMVSGQIIVSTAAGAPSLLLEDMCVTSVYRRSGVGTVLLETLISWAREKGAARIQLVTDRDNYPADMFYQKHGFSKSRMVGMYKKI